MRSLIILVFLAFAFVILTSADVRRNREESKADLLSRLSEYKSWKQVNRVDAAPATGAFMIEASSISG